MTPEMWYGLARLALAIIAGILGSMGYVDKATAQSMIDTVNPTVLGLGTAGLVGGLAYSSIKDKVMADRAIQQGIKAPSTATVPEMKQIAANPPK